MQVQTKFWTTALYLGVPMLTDGIQWDFIHSRVVALSLPEV